MPIQNAFELKSFFANYIANTDSDGDELAVRSFIDSASTEKQAQVIAQARAFAEADGLVELLGMETNRWFGDVEEAREWLQKIVTLLSSAAEDAGHVVVKDSNGTGLSEGDAVTVIKDLKVKGGSSDLKRGTLIKKIHLIGDPDNIECNVDGSTLVLKTMFLKKA